MQAGSKREFKESLLSRFFENNTATLLKFLSFQDQANLKLVNRSAYYNIVTASLWNQIKMQIVADKYQYIQDDFELDNNEPQPKEEAEVKLFRNIRIHSLNKRVGGESSLNKHKEAIKETAQERFPSTSKNRLLIKAPSSNLKFLKTEIGFKKISISSKSSMNYDYLLQLPDKLQLSMLSPHGKQSMQQILQRQSLIGEMLNRWVDYQKRILEPMSIQLSKQSEQTAFWKVRESLISEYNKRFSTEKYLNIIANIYKMMILDDSLKKKMQTFTANHKTIEQFSKHVEPLRITYEKIESKMLALKQLSGFKYWQEIEDILQTFQAALQQSSTFLEKKVLNFAENIDTLIQSGLLVLDLSIKKLCMQSEEMELVVELLNSVCSKLMKTLSECSSKFRQSLLIAKYQKYRCICGSISKMSKFFSKVKAQLKQKQKNKKTGDDIEEIRKFISHYENYENEYVIMDEKSIQKVEKQMSDLQKRIDLLKSNLKKQKQTQ